MKNIFGGNKKVAVSGTTTKNLDTPNCRLVQPKITIFKNKKTLRLQTEGVTLVKWGRPGFGDLRKKEASRLRFCFSLFNLVLLR